MTVFSSWPRTRISEPIGALTRPRRAPDGVVGTKRPPRS
jgi:hypothetical protein